MAPKDQIAPYLEDAPIGTQMGHSPISLPKAAPMIIQVHGQAEGQPVSLPHAHFMLGADYERHGTDLILVGKDGHEIILKGYFDTDNPPELVAADTGATIDGALVSKLAGPLAPGQVAQAGGDNVLGSPIGKVETVSGEVRVSHADGTKGTLEKGDAVYQGDQLNSSVGSNAGITLADGSALSLGEGTRMVLDDLVYDPTGAGGDAQVDLLKGSATFISGQISKTNPDAFVIKTPVTSIGIRGTAGGIGVSDDGATTAALLPEANGTGEMSLGGQVLNQPGVSSSVTSPGAPPSAPEVMSNAAFGATFGSALAALPGAAQHIQAAALQQAIQAFTQVQQQQQQQMNQLQQQHQQQQQHDNTVAPPAGGATQDAAQQAIQVAKAVQVVQQALALATTNALLANHQALIEAQQTFESSLGTQNSGDATAAVEAASLVVEAETVMGATIVSGVVTGVTSTYSGQYAALHTAFTDFNDGNYSSLSDDYTSVSAYLGTVSTYNTSATALASAHIHSTLVQDDQVTVSLLLTESSAYVAQALELESAALNAGEGASNWSSGSAISLAVASADSVTSDSTALSSATTALSTAITILDAAQLALETPFVAQAGAAATESSYFSSLESALGTFLTAVGQTVSSSPTLTELITAVNSFTHTADTTENSTDVSASGSITDLSAALDTYISNNTLTAVESAYYDGFTATYDEWNAASLALAQADASLEAAEATYDADLSTALQAQTAQTTAETNLATAVSTEATLITDVLADQQLDANTVSSTMSTSLQSVSSALSSALSLGTTIQADATAANSLTVDYYFNGGSTVALANEVSAINTAVSSLYNEYTAAASALSNASYALYSEAALPSNLAAAVTDSEDSTNTGLYHISAALAQVDAQATSAYSVALANYNQVLAIEEQVYNAYSLALANQAQAEADSTALVNAGASDGITIVGGDSSALASVLITAFASAAATSTAAITSDSAALYGIAGSLTTEISTASTSLSSESSALISDTGTASVYHVVSELTASSFAAASLTANSSLTTEFAALNGNTATVTFAELTAAIASEAITIGTLLTGSISGYSLAATNDLTAASTAVTAANTDYANAYALSQSDSQQSSDVTTAEGYASDAAGQVQNVVNYETTLSNDKGSLSTISTSVSSSYSQLASWASAALQYQNAETTLGLESATVTAAAAINVSAGTAGTEATINTEYNTWNSVSLTAQNADATAYSQLSAAESAAVSALSQLTTALASASVDLQTASADATTAQQYYVATALLAQSGTALAAAQAEYEAVVAEEAVVTIQTTINNLEASIALESSTIAAESTIASEASFNLSVAVAVENSITVIASQALVATAANTDASTQAALVEKYAQAVFSDLGNSSALTSDLTHLNSATAALLADATTANTAYSTGSTALANATTYSGSHSLFTLGTATDTSTSTILTTGTSDLSGIATSTASLSSTESAALAVASQAIAASTASAQSQISAISNVVAKDYTQATSLISTDISGSSSTASLALVAAASALSTLTSFTSSIISSYSASVYGSTSTVVGSLYAQASSLITKLSTDTTNITSETTTLNSDYSDLATQKSSLATLVSTNSTDVATAQLYAASASLDYTGTSSAPGIVGLDQEVDLYAGAITKAVKNVTALSSALTQYTTALANQAAQVSAALSSASQSVTSSFAIASTTTSGTATESASAGGSTVTITPSYTLSTNTFVASQSETITGTALHGTVTVTNGSIVHYTANADYHGKDTISLTAVDTATIQDGSSGEVVTSSASTNVTISVAEVELQSKLAAMSYTGITDTSFTLGTSVISSAYSSPDNTSLSKVILVTGPSHGTLTLSGTVVSAGTTLTLTQYGSLHYVPTSSYAGTDSFTVESLDSYQGTLASAAQTVSITLSSAPLSADIVAAEAAVAGSLTVSSLTPSATIVESTAALTSYALTPTFGTTTNSEVTAQTVSLTSVSVADGTATLSNGTIHYTPTADFHGTETFTLTAVDTATIVSSATTKTLVSTVTTSLTVSVAETDYHSTLANTNVYANEGSSVTLGTAAVASAYSSPDGTALADIKVLSLPTHGTLTLNGTALTGATLLTEAQYGALVYTPSSTYSGVDSFTVESLDSYGAALNTLGTTPLYSAASTVSLFVTSTDSTITLAQITAAQGAVSSSFAISSTTVAGTIQENGVTQGTLTPHFTTESGNTLVTSQSTSVTSATALDGSVTIDGSSVLYSPNSYFHGTDTITLVGTDTAVIQTGNSTYETVTTTNTSTVHVTVAETEFASTLSNISFTVNQGSSATLGTSGIVSAYSSPDNTALGDVIVLNLPTHGTLSLNGTALTGSTMLTEAQYGSLIYTPNATYSGTDSFTVESVDSYGVSLIAAGSTAVFSSPATVSIGVAESTAAAESAVATGFELSASYQTGTATEGTLSGSTVTITAIYKETADNAAILSQTATPTSATAAHGTVTVSNGTLSYHANADFYGVDTITLVSTDTASLASGTTYLATNTSTLNVTVAESDLGSTLSAMSYAVTENSTLTFGSSVIEAAYTSPDNTALGFVQIESVPTHGVLTLNGAAVVAGSTVNISDFASMIYTPAEGYSGSDSFTVESLDAYGVSLASMGSESTVYSAAQTISLNVEAATGQSISLSSLTGTQTVYGSGNNTFSLGTSDSGTITVVEAGQSGVVDASSLADNALLGASQSGNNLIIQLSSSGGGGEFIVSNQFSSTNPEGLAYIETNNSESSTTYLVGDTGGTLSTLSGGTYSNALIVANSSGVTTIDAGTGSDQIFAGGANNQTIVGNGSFTVSSESDGISVNGKLADDNNGGSTYRFNDATVNYAEAGTTGTHGIVYNGAQATTPNAGSDAVNFITATGINGGYYEDVWFDATSHTLYAQTYNAENQAIGSVTSLAHFATSVSISSNAIANFGTGFEMALDLATTTTGSTTSYSREILTDSVSTTTGTSATPTVSTITSAVATANAGDNLTIHNDVNASGTTAGTATLSWTNGSGIYTENVVTNSNAAQSVTATTLTATSSSTVSNLSVAYLGTVGTVEVWQNSTGTYQISGSEFAQSSLDEGVLTSASLVGLSHIALNAGNANGFVLAAVDGTNSLTGHQNILVESFSANGLLENEQTIDSGYGTVSEVKIKVLSQGGYVAEWDSQSVGISAQVFDPSGDTIGAAPFVIAHTTSSISLGNLATLSTGGFVAAYTYGNQGYSQAYDAAGEGLATVSLTVGSNTTVNTDTLVNISQVEGTSGNDIFNLTSGNLQLRGTDGDDVYNNSLGLSNVTLSYQNFSATGEGVLDINLATGIVTKPDGDSDTLNGIFNVQGNGQEDEIFAGTISGDTYFIGSGAGYGDYLYGSTTGVHVTFQIDPSEPTSIQGGTSNNTLEFQQYSTVVPSGTFSLISEAETDGGTDQRYLSGISTINLYNGAINTINTDVNSALDTVLPLSGTTTGLTETLHIEGNDSTVNLQGSWTEGSTDNNDNTTYTAQGSGSFSTDTIDLVVSSGVLVNVISPISLDFTPDTGGVLQTGSNGTNQAYAVGTDLNLSGQSFTFTAWTNRSATGSYQAIAGEGPPDVDGSPQLGWVDANDFYVDFYGDRLTYTVSSTLVGQWVNWGVSFNNSNKLLTLYENGTAVASQTMSGTLSGTGDTFVIGNDGYSGSVFDGFIGDAKLWTTSLSAAQIAAEVATSDVIDTTGNVGDWTMSGTSAFLVNDLSGNGNNLTLSNTSVVHTVINEGDNIGQFYAPEDGATSGLLTSTDSAGGTVTWTLGTVHNGTVTIGTNGLFTYTSNAGFIGTDSFTAIATDNLGNSVTETVDVTVSSNPISGAVAYQLAPEVSTALAYVGSYNVNLSSSSVATGTGAFTYGMWVYSPYPTNEHLLITGSSSTGQGAYFYLASTGQLALEFSGGYGANSPVGLDLVTANQWHYVAATYSGVSAGGSLNLYVDGNLVGSSIQTNVDIVSGVAALGGDGNVFIGSFAQVGVWDAALTQAQIVANMTSDTPSDTANLLAYYTMNDATSGTLTDTSGYGHNISLSGISGVSATSVVSNTQGEASSTLTVTQGSTYNGQLSATDSDGGTLTWSLGNQPSNGSVSLAADGDFTFTSTGTFTGVESFTVIATDGSGTSANETIDVTVSSPIGTAVAYQLAPSVSTVLAYSGTYNVNFSASSLATGTGAFTYGMWVYSPSTPSGEYLITQGNNDAGQGVDFYFASAGQLQLEFSGGVGAASANGVVTANQWHYVAATYSGVSAGGTIDLYVDGNLVGTGIDTSVSLVSGSAGLGGSGAFFTGDLAQVGVWGAALTQAQIEANMTSSTPSDTAALLAYYSMSDAASGTLTDTSGHGNNISISGVSQVSAVSVTSNTQGEASSTLSVTQGSTYNGQLSATDSNGGTLTWSLSGEPSNGSVSLATDGDFTFTSTGTFTGVESFVVTATDSSGASATETIDVAVVAAIHSIAVAAPSVSAGLAFNGSNQISLADPSTLATGTSFTYGMWVNAAEPTSNREGILTLGNISSNNNSAFLYLNTNGTFGFDTWAQSYVSTSAVAANGQWNYIAATLDDGTLDLYVNGNLSAQTKVTLNMTSGSAALGGSYESYSNINNFVGEMAQFGVWNTALTQAQIEANMVSSTPSDTGNLVAYYALNDAASGTIASTYGDITSISLSSYSGDTSAAISSTSGNSYTISGSSLAGHLGAVDSTGASFISWTPETNIATTHGTITVDTAGDFTYVANAGYYGADSFTVTATDSNGASASQVIDVTTSNPTAIQDVQLSVPSVSAGVSFTGSNLIALTNPSVLATGTGAFTYGMWVHAPIVSGVNQQLIYIGTLAENESVSMQIGSDGILAMQANAVGGPQTATALTANQWYYVAATYSGASNGGTMSLYVDGNLVGTAVDTGINVTSGIAYLGGAASNSPAFGFEGTMAQVGVWNVALTQAQIEANMTSNAAVLEGSGNLLAYYPFDSRDGGYAYDQSNNESSVYVGANNSVSIVGGGSQTLFTAVENGAYSGVLTAVDTNGDTVSFSDTGGANLPSHGTLSLSSNGSFTYTPTTGYVGTDSFTVTATDSAGGATTQTIDVTVSSNTLSVDDYNNILTTSQLAGYKVIDIDFSGNEYTQDSLFQTGSTAFESLTINIATSTETGYFSGIDVVSTSTLASSTIIIAGSYDYIYNYGTIISDSIALNGSGEDVNIYTGTINNSTITFGNYNNQTFAEDIGASITGSTITMGNGASDNIMIDGYMDAASSINLGTGSYTLSLAAAGAETIATDSSGIGQNYFIISAADTASLGYVPTLNYYQSGSDDISAQFTYGDGINALNKVVVTNAATGAMTLEESSNGGTTYYAYAKLANSNMNSNSGTMDLGAVATLVSTGVETIDVTSETNSTFSLDSSVAATIVNNIDIFATQSLTINGASSDHMIMTGNWTQLSSSALAGYTEYTHAGTGDFTSTNLDVFVQNSFTIVNDGPSASFSGTTITHAAGGTIDATLSGIENDTAGTYYATLTAGAGELAVNSYDVSVTTVSSNEIVLEGGYSALTTALASISYTPESATDTLSLVVIDSEDESLISSSTAISVSLAAAAPSLVAESFSQAGYASTGAVSTQTDNVTVESLVDWKPNGSSNSSYIFYNGNSSSSGYGLFIDQYGHLILLEGGHNEESAVISGTTAYTLASNQWSQIALVRNSGSFSVDVNGTSYAFAAFSGGVDTVSSINSSTDKTTIGNAYAPGSGTAGAAGYLTNGGFEGDIAQVAFWNTVRTTTQIASDLNSISLSSSNLAADFVFDTGVGSNTSLNGGATLTLSSASLVSTAPTLISSYGQNEVVAVAGTAALGQVIANDALGDTLTYAIASQASLGTVTLGSNGAFTYTPTSGVYGADSFVMNITGPGGTTADTIQLASASASYTDNTQTFHYWTDSGLYNNASADGVFTIIDSSLTDNVSATLIEVGLNVIYGSSFAILANYAFDLLGSSLVDSSSDFTIQGNTTLSLGAGAVLTDDGTFTYYTSTLTGAGTLLINGSFVNEGGGGYVLIDNGNLDFGVDSTGITLGLTTIAGTGTIYNDGTSTSLLGDGTTISPTFVNNADGTLDLYSGSGFYVTVDSFYNYGVMYVNGGFDLYMNQIFTNAGEITLNVSSYLSFYDASSSTASLTATNNGTILLEGAQLYVQGADMVLINNGSILEQIDDYSSLIYLYSGASFDNYGLIEGNTANGLSSTEYQIGSSGVTGTVVLESTSDLVLHNIAGNFDELYVTGNSLTLGGTLNILIEETPILYNSSERVIYSNDGYTGSFQTIHGLYDPANQTYLYDPTYDSSGLIVTQRALSESVPETSTSLTGEYLLGGSQGDTLNGAGYSGDVLIGTGGNNSFIIDSTAFDFISGSSSGYNKLLWEPTNTTSSTFNLASVTAGLVENVQEIDLSQVTGASLTLNATTAIAMEQGHYNTSPGAVSALGTTPALVITGGSSESVTFTDNGWSTTGTANATISLSGHTDSYVVYTNSNNNIAALIDSHLTVHTHVS